MQQTRSAGMNRATPYLYVIPCILLLGIFVYIPLVVNFFYSTQTFSAFSPTKTFVGLTNYKEMLADPVIRTAIVNNIWYCVISVIFQVGLSLCIAAVLEDKLLRHVSTMLRTMYFLPVLISMTVVALLFSFVYHPKIGLINAGLKMIGLGNLAHAWFFTDPTWARVTVIIVDLWIGIPYTMLIVSGILMNIPEDLYEAAEIDGAGRLRRFINVTLPQVKEMTFVMCVTTVTGAFLVFNDVYILTGGPGNASTTLAVYMYKNGFALDKMGYASTIAVGMLIISMILALIQNRAFGSGKED